MSGGSSPVLAQQVRSDDGMGTGHLVGQRLADVVQERGAFALVDIEAELPGHQAGQVGALDQVAQHVLAVGGPILQGAQDRHQIRSQRDDPGGGTGILGGFQAAFLDPSYRSLVRLLDPDGLDPAVVDQIGQREAGGLPAYRVEAGDEHGAGGCRRSSR